MIGIGVLNLGYFVGRLWEGRKTTPATGPGGRGDNGAKDGVWAGPGRGPEAELDGAQLALGGGKKGNFLANFRAKG